MRIDFFMFIMFWLGLYLVSAGNNIDLKTLGCNSKRLKNVTKSILIIGVIFIVMSLSHLVYNFNCNCDQNRNVGEFIYLFITFILGLTLIVLFSIIKAESKTVNCENANKEFFFGSGGILTTGIVLLLLFLVRFFYNFYIKNPYEIRRKN